MCIHEALLLVLNQLLDMSVCLIVVSGRKEKLFFLKKNIYIYITVGYHYSAPPSK